MSGSIVILSVAMALDPVPGTFHTKESARDQVQAILTSMIPHYHPTVIIDPEES